MGGSISTGWNITKQSLRALKEDKEIIIFPILSIIITLAITAVFVVALFTTYLGSPLFSGDIYSAHFFFVCVIYALIVRIVSSFFQAAIVTSATIRFSGKNPSLGDGLSGPLKIIHKIFLWAIVSTIVSMILGAIQNAFRKGGRGIEVVAGAGTGILGLAWGMATLFVIPVMLFEKESMLGSIKRSKDLFVKTWGENISAQVATGGIFVIAAILGVIPPLLFMIFDLEALVIPSLILAVLWFCIIVVLAVSVDGIVKAALYSYAVSGKMPEIYEEETAKAMTRKGQTEGKK
jgi:hypothetical protein